ncbi:hypothetical protein [Salinispora sp. H7-4]|uniref:hypothetical protein n=1 Tax=Salinispora sp. H7-4 TaxID=2748321 RepID=UPI0015D31FEE|nr:hypothetical protein [Salinispora sp. H7-4]NYT94852.1 hypothetical protein [Salinispora sp. H7-4]
MGTDDHAYGVMLSHFPYMAFYAKGVSFDENGDASESPIFVVLVSRAAYSAGGWGKPIRHLPVENLYPIPRFFWQSPVNKADCKIIEPIKRRVTAAPSDCVGLEAEAIWDDVHIESRISDVYAGRSNIFAESLRLKL